MPDAVKSGRSAGRLEDQALLTGRGRFADDDLPQGAAHAVFVRSPYAAADIVAIKTDDARCVPGILSVLTAADMTELGSAAQPPPIVGRNGTRLIAPFRPALAVSAIVHIGQAVAMVIATTRQAAIDAADRVQVEYRSRPAVVDIQAALASDAPQVHADVPNNVVLDWAAPAGDGNNAAVERAFARAHYIARASITQPRVAVVSLEPRGATASYDCDRDRYHLRCGTQGAQTVRDQLAAAMRIAPERLDVTTDDVGGGFGLKASIFPEHPALLVAARLVKRPVHWMSDRSEAFLSDNQARDSVAEGELALDRTGRFLALRVRQIGGVGAYVTSIAAQIPTANFARCLPGVYDIPLIEVESRCVVTNTIPLGPYRGAGRPEANYLLECLVEEAARITGIDPVRIRQDNLIRPSALPYATAMGTTYDSGDFPAVLRRALDASEHHSFEKRRREATSRGRLRGIGISCFLEHAGGVLVEGASLKFLDDVLEVGIGVGSSGQGHRTVFSNVATAELGLPAERIQFCAGLSRLEIKGNAAVGSRSTATVSAAIVKAAARIVEKGRPIAATMLEADPADVTYREGSFVISGTDRSIDLFSVARYSSELVRRGELEEGLDTKLSTETPHTFPNGCHIAEVEIDPDIGAIEVVRYTAVDDNGRLLNETIVSGQVHGGVAQGLGQALMERVVYDSDSGQVITGSLMDYGMPLAAQLPDIDTQHVVSPATSNPLGVKGVGESGTTGSLAAIMNAIADAIPGASAARINMPATPETIWRACRDAGQRN